MDIHGGFTFLVPPRSADIERRNWARGRRSSRELRARWRSVQTSTAVAVTLDTHEDTFPAKRRPSASHTWSLWNHTCVCLMHHAQTLMINATLLMFSAPHCALRSSLTLSVCVCVCVADAWRQLQRLHTCTHSHTSVQNFRPHRVWCFSPSSKFYYGYNYSLP